MLKECCKSQYLNVNYSEIKKELLMDSWWPKTRNYTFDICGELSRKHLQKQNNSGMKWAAETKFKREENRYKYLLKSAGLQVIYRGYVFLWSMWVYDKIVRS
jgi:hypothetical protein